METTYDIPIIARGRVIMPGVDAVEFSGRAGARFRCPDPHEHIQDLVLGDTNRLLDLQETPVAEILDFLAALGSRLTLDNPYIKEAFDLSLSAGGLTEPVLRNVYEQLPRMFDRAYLEAMIERTVGVPYLDGWVQQGADRLSRFRVRAVGTRSLHITAGNVPVVGALTVIRSALTKGDCLIKLPSNDPLSATAVARTMIDLDANHPVTKHVAVAYWKGGDDLMGAEICRTSRIDKITAWGGMSSMKYIQKFLAPGLDLISLNPKLSISIVGREALGTQEEMREAATGVAIAAGKLNQTACVNTRVVYVESGTDDASIERVIEFGRQIFHAIQRLPTHLSTAAPRRDAELESEMRALDLVDDAYWLIGDTVKGGVIVSRLSERVEFHDMLNNRVVNVVPMPDIMQMVQWCDDSTQTVGIYPERLQLQMRDALSMAGVQRMLPLKADESASGVDGGDFPGMPHDGIEPLRRMVRWVISESPADASSASSDSGAGGCALPPKLQASQKHLDADINSALLLCGR